MQNYAFWTMCTFPSIKKYWQNLIIFLVLGFRALKTVLHSSHLELHVVSCPSTGCISYVDFYLSSSASLPHETRNFLVNFSSRGKYYFRHNAKARWLICLLMFASLEGRQGEPGPVRGFLEVRWGSGEDTYIKIWVPKMCIICQIIFLSFQFDN